MNQIAAKTKCDIVTDSITDDIVKGIYPLDSRLPTESELCEKYGVSRITIRESLKRLSSMGLVTIQQGRGTFVSNVDVGTFMAPLMQLIEFGSFDIETIYDARLCIETGTCRLAARNRTQEDTELLNRYVDQMDECVRNDDVIKMLELDSKFHFAIAEISRNQILRACVINLERISLACATKLNKLYMIMDEANEHHRKIALAIGRGDENAAGEAITEHTQKAKIHFTK